MPKNLYAHHHGHHQDGAEDNYIPSLYGLGLILIIPYIFVVGKICLRYGIRIYFRRAKVKPRPYQGNTMRLHTYNLQLTNLPNNDFQHLMVSEIQPREDFKDQGHYGKVKGKIKVIQ